VFSADVLAPDATLRMKHWMSKGLTGMRLFTTGSTMPDQADWLDDPRCFPVWDLAQSAKLPVCLQMTAKAIPQLVQLLDRFPRVRVILDHCARPHYEDGPPYAAAQSLWDLKRRENVFLKITPHNFLGARKGAATPETFFKKLIAEFGAQRIAWGSNFPAHEGSLTELLAMARESVGFASAQDKEWIFGKTGQSLYPALKDS
jgi:predicted TIM-barrel fold metal-dependent hydrolase